MDGKQHGNSQRLLIILIALLVLINVALLAVVLGGRDSPGGLEQGGSVPSRKAEEANSSDQTGEKNGESAESGISIPGYGKLSMVSGRTTQTVNLYNPEDNNCYFIIGLYVDDNLVYESDRVDPGSHIYSIELKNTLETGVYSGKITYECYSLIDDKEFNGAVIELEIEVQ